jgi:hypothetical protein
MRRTKKRGPEKLPGPRECQAVPQAAADENIRLSGRNHMPLRNQA